MDLKIALKRITMSYTQKKWVIDLLKVSGVPSCFSFTLFICHAFQTTHENLVSHSWPKKQAEFWNFWWDKAHKSLLDKDLQQFLEMCPQRKLIYYMNCVLKFTSPQACVWICEKLTKMHTNNTHKTLRAYSQIGRNWLKAVTLYLKKSKIKSSERN